jgi:hypothetical protein
MKPGVIFFLVLCFHLFGGVDTVHAGTPFCVSHSHLRAFNKKQQVKNTNQPAVEVASVRDENTDFIIFEDKDDEEFSTRKYLLAANSFSALHFALITRHLCTLVAAPHKVNDQLSLPASCIYIEQRVLRI